MHKGIDWIRQIYTDISDKHILPNIDVICEVDKYFYNSKDRDRFQKLWENSLSKNDRVNNESTSSSSGESKSSDTSSNSTNIWHKSNQGSLFIYTRKIKESLLDDNDMESTSSVEESNFLNKSDQNNILSTYITNENDQNCDDSSLFSKDSSTVNSTSSPKSSDEIEDIIEQCLGPFESTIQANIDKKKENTNERNKNVKKMLTKKQRNLPLRKKINVDNQRQPIKGWDSTLDPPVDEIIINNNQDKSENKRQKIFKNYCENSKSKIDEEFNKCKQNVDSKEYKIQH